MRKGRARSTKSRILVVWVMNIEHIITRIQVILMHKMTGISKKRPDTSSTTSLPTLLQNPIDSTLQTQTTYSDLEVSLMGVCVVCVCVCVCVCACSVTLQARGNRCIERGGMGRGLHKTKGSNPNHSQRPDYCSTAVTHRNRKLVRLLY